MSVSVRSLDILHGSPQSTEMYVQGGVHTVVVGGYRSQPEGSFYNRGKNGRPQTFFLGFPGVADGTEFRLVL